MGLFVREKLIYKERGKKEEWKRAQALLKCTLFTGHPVRRVHFALYD